MEKDRNIGLKIKYTCPECSNDEFVIIETFVQAGYFPKKEGPATRAGRYRAKCTVCDHPELLITKNPELYEENQQEEEKPKQTIWGKVNGVPLQNYDSPINDEQ